MSFESFKTDKVRVFPGFNRMADYKWHLGDRRRHVNLLELGVLNGESLLLWRAFFPHSTIVGIDRTIPHNFVPPPRTTLCQGEQDDDVFLAAVGRTQGPFDIIVDDCSHLGDLSRVSFWCLWPYLKPGGLYVIEDWGTGYLRDWPDGHRYKAAYPHTFLRKLARPLGLRLRWPCHSYGMVGFVKELVDHMAMFDIIRGVSSNMEGGISPFESMVFTPGAVIITKRENELLA